MRIRAAELRDAERLYALISLNRDQLVPRSLGNVVEMIDRFVLTKCEGEMVGCAAYQIHPEIGNAEAAAVEPAAEEHGCARGGGCVFRGGVARQEGQAGRARQACRQGLAQDVQGAGVLLLRNSGRTQVAFCAAWQVARLEMPARRMRRLANGIRAAFGVIPRR